MKMTFETTYSLDDQSLLAQLEAISQYRPIVLEACEKYGFQPSIIAGLGSRESAWGLALKPPGPGGTGDFERREFPTHYRSTALPPDGLGFGRGLMQIDFDWHEFARNGLWQDPRENILYGCELLLQYCSNIGRNIFYRPLTKDLQSLTPQELLRAALASYNAGPDRVLKAIRIQGIENVDFVTTGRNFSTNVLNRAGWFQMHGME